MRRFLGGTVAEAQYAASFPLLAVTNLQSFDVLAVEQRAWKFQLAVYASH